MAVNKTGIEYLTSKYKQRSPKDLVDLLLVHQSKFKGKFPELNCGYYL